MAPLRAREYGPVLSGLLELGRKADGREVAKIHRRRKEFSGRLEALLREVDVLLMPAMDIAAPTLDYLAAHRDDPQARYARVRFTAPFDMTGSPCLTLPGGATQESLPVGFQLVGRHFAEALLLRAGHSYQQASDWHRRRPPL